MVLTYETGDAGTPDEAASDPPSAGGGFILDSTTLDELAQRAPVSGAQRRGRAGRCPRTSKAVRGESTSVV